MKARKKQGKQERSSAFFIQEFDYSVTYLIYVYKELPIEKQSSTEENGLLLAASFRKWGLERLIGKRYFIFIIGSVTWMLHYCFMLDNGMSLH